MTNKYPRIESKLHGLLKEINEMKLGGKEQRMKLTKEDKCRIVARNFYTDNPDQYEDYHEALTEFMSGNNCSDTFIEFCVAPYLKPEDGCEIVMSDIGHVASVRLLDGFFNPRTEMTQDEGEAMEEAFHKAADEYPDLDGLDLLLKTGWKKI